MKIIRILFHKTTATGLMKVWKLLQSGSITFIARTTPHTQDTTVLTMALGILTTVHMTETWLFPASQVMCNNIIIILNFLYLHIIIKMSIFAHPWTDVATSVHGCKT